MNQTANSNKPKISKKAAMDALWRQGILVWKLDKNQKALYELFHNSSHKIQTWLLARRSGKTYALCVLAIETCLKQPNSIVKFVAPTKLQINNILRPLMRKILEDCPEDIKPEVKEKDYIYYFPNGSEIQLAGTESGHIEKLRGGDSHLSIIDEAQSCMDLNNAVKSVLLPTTLITKGKILIAGTPPRDPDHDFIGFIEDGEARGSLVKRTIYENPRLTPEMIDEMVKEMGGSNTEEFKREALCQIIKDPSSSVIPEFTADLEKEIIKEWPKPVFYDTYESMDLGFTDLTGILFAYYDFKLDKVIIEDEYAVKGIDVQIPKLIENIKKKEQTLWTNPLTNEIKKPYLRVSDINYIVLHEISRFSNKEINFIAARKDDKEAAINTLRVMLANKKIIINPRCEILIRHLRNVKWDKQRKQFARSPMDDHYDMVDALIYLVRHIVYTKNPYPAHYDLNLRPEDTFIYNQQRFESKTKGINIQNFYKMMNIKTNKK
jgi:hypothetical protein